MGEKEKAIFENLKRIAAVMVKTYGRNFEAAIHDFDYLPRSLIHIEGTVTNRKPGAPITDLVLRALRREGDNVQDIISCRNLTKNGRITKSSTTFIRNLDGKVIGAFCLNFDITEYLNATALVDEFVQTANSDGGVGSETFASSVSETIESLLDQAVQKAGKQPGTMTKEERVKLVESLELQGAFLIKGSVDFVAKALGISRYTVYNYLKEVRNN